MVSDEATVSVSISPENDIPTVEIISKEITEDANSVTINLIGNDVDSDDDASSLTYSIVSQPGAGTLINNNDGTVTYTNPTTDFQNLAVGETVDITFTYKATDSHGADSNISTATITITGTNDAPIVTKTIDDKSYYSTDEINFNINGVFKDIDNNSSMSFSAKLADGSDLPEWLNFDAENLTFSGSAPLTKKI